MPSSSCVISHPCSSFTPLHSSISKSVSWATHTWQREALLAICYKQCIYWYWFTDSASTSMSVGLIMGGCVCSSICVHTLRQGLTALCVCVCVCVRALPKFKVCCGNPRSSARAKRSRLQNWRRCRIRVPTPWKTSGRRRYVRRSWRAGIFCSPTPRKQPWARGRPFESARLADFAASGHALLYCSKNLYSFMLLKLMWIFQWWKMNAVCPG